MEKHGRIIKGIAGFYYVRTEDDSLYECKARGSFRNEKKKPLVGDYVTISILKKKKKTGSLDQIIFFRIPAECGILFDIIMYIFAKIHKIFVDTVTELLTAVKC